MFRKVNGQFLTTAKVPYLVKVTDNFYPFTQQSDSRVGWGWLYTTVIAKLGIGGNDDNPVTKRGQNQKLETRIAEKSEANTTIPHSIHTRPSGLCHSSIPAV